MKQFASVHLWAFSVCLRLSTGQLKRVQWLLNVRQSGSGQRINIERQNVDGGAGVVVDGAAPGAEMVKGLQVIGAASTARRWSKARSGHVVRGPVGWAGR